MVCDMEHSRPALDADREATRVRAVSAFRGLRRPVDDPKIARLLHLAVRLFDARQAELLLIDHDGLTGLACLGPASRHSPAFERLAGLIVTGGKPLIEDEGPAQASTRPNGSDGHGRLAAAPLIDPAGHVVGMLRVEGLNLARAVDPLDLDALADLAATAMASLLKAAGHERRRDQSRNLESERLALAIGAASLGEFEWDIAGDRFRISPRMAKIAGVPEGEIPSEGGMALFAFVHPEDRESTNASVADQLEKRGRYEVECRRVPDADGRTHWTRAAGVMVHDEAGSPSRLIGVVQDITGRRLQDEQRESLLAELDHRIKNLLAVVQSVAAQSARKSSSLDAFLKTFAARLKSMSSAHDLLSAARWRGATLARIAAAELGGLAPTQTRWDGPELFLTPRAASALSLTLHELAVNAVKYGSLSVENGKVEVVWRRSASGGFSLEWLETGGPPASPPTRRGFGATLIEDVVGRELGGTASMDYRRSGLCALIQAAADALAEGPPPEPAPSATPERIVETLIAADETIRPGAIAGLKVLIVEDSLLLALELEAGLEDAGVEVVGCAAELGEALSMLGLTFDVAVLDADLNGQSVAPVAEMLRREGRPFVFATGYADKAAPMGFDAPIVRKPYNVHQIARAIADVTGRS
ncbi:HWE histidine kinase domain-containing protein [Caulobacter sp. HMWF009]